VATILCVDDDQYLMDLLRYALERDRFRVLLAGTGRQALSAVCAHKVHLIVLDIALPDMSGLKVLRLLRAFSRVPVIMLTASTREEDVIASLQGGADDYVAKPCSVPVLLKHITAVLRRVRGPRVVLPPAGAVYHARDFIFNSGTNEVRSQDTSVRLTHTESRILHLLFLQAGRPLSAQRIIEHVWGDDSERTIAVVKTHIKHLRRKMQMLPNSPEAIYTVRRGGYMVKLSDALSRRRAPVQGGEESVAAPDSQVPCARRGQCYVWTR
jgi:DNA-binding response OmpR family regulator